MTTPDPLDNVTQVAQLLRRVVSAHGDVKAMPAGREQAIARIADALVKRRALNRRRRLWAGFALAATIALGLGLGFALHGRALKPTPAASTAPQELGRLADPNGVVTALRDGQPQPVAVGARLAEGTELRTSSAEANLDFESGTHVTLGRASRLQLVEQTSHKRFSLEAGELTAKVAKLGPNDRFVVATADSEVEVRGTMFRVSVVPPDPTCGGGTPTRLDVTEGVVVVRHAGSEVRVAAGERWPVCVTAPTRMLRPSRIVPSSSVFRNASGAPAEASSKLAEQNDLFDEGMRLKRGGDAGGACARFDRLLATYPSGPLAESAAVERMRVLTTTDRPRAVLAAREYLRRHPQGFARAEAEALAP